VPLCPDVARLVEEITKGAGCAVVVEDVIALDDISVLATSIDAQPAWSDFLMVVLTPRTDVPKRNVLAIRLQDVLGNVTFLKRPFHPTTLVNVVRAALRSRRRQYGAREVLERRDLLARELQHRTKNLLADIATIELRRAGAAARRYIRGIGRHSMVSIESPGKITKCG
jgi:FixJ family two-component response regulator